MHFIGAVRNVERPEDFTGHSLSVSDVIALKRQNEVKYYYVDSVGFRELPGFDSGRNPLRGIEDMVEQNDNQLDGVINNVPAETVAEKEAKSSAIEKLKATAPEKETFRAKICEDIDAVIARGPADFEEFLKMMQEQEYEIKRGKHPAVKGKGQKRFIRFKSLGEGYTPEDIKKTYQRRRRTRAGR